jgi:hypothetical protein
VRVVAVERLAVWRIEALAVGTVGRSRSEGRVLALAERRQGWQGERALVGLERTALALRAMVALEGVALTV